MVSLILKGSCKLLFENIFTVRRIFCCISETDEDLSFVFII